MHGTTRPVNGGCKVMAYLESQTPSFLLTYNFDPATVTIKGHLLSSTATVKCFQIKNNQSPPEWKALLPITILQPCGDGKLAWWGYQAEKKFDDIFIHFDTILACDS